MEEDHGQAVCRHVHGGGVKMGGTQPGVKFIFQKQEKMYSYKKYF